MSQKSRHKLTLKATRVNFPISRSFIGMSSRPERQQVLFLMKKEKLFPFKWHFLPPAGIRHEQYRRALLLVIHQSKQSGFQPNEIKKVLKLAVKF